MEILLAFLLPVRRQTYFILHTIVAYFFSLLFRLGSAHSSLSLFPFFSHLPHPRSRPRCGEVEDSTQLSDSLVESIPLLRMCNYPLLTQGIKVECSRGRHAYERWRITAGKISREETEKEKRIARIAGEVLR